MARYRKPMTEIEFWIHTCGAMYVEVSKLKNEHRKLREAVENAYYEIKFGNVFDGLRELENVRG